MWIHVSEAFCLIFPQNFLAHSVAKPASWSVESWWSSISFGTALGWLNSSLVHWFGAVLEQILSDIWFTMQYNICDNQWIGKQAEIRTEKTQFSQFRQLGHSGKICKHWCWLWNKHLPHSVLASQLQFFITPLGWETPELPRREPDLLRDVSSTQWQTKTQSQHDKDPMANSALKIKSPLSTLLPRVNFPLSLGTYTGSAPFCLPLPPDPFHSTGTTYTNGSGWAGMSIPCYSTPPPPGVWHGQLAATSKAPNELDMVLGQLGLPTAGLMLPTAHAYGSGVHLVNRHVASSLKTPSTPDKLSDL